MHRILLPGLILAAAFAQSGSAEEWNRKYTVSGKPSIRVQTDDASVDVRAGGSGQVEARVITKGFAIGPDEVRVSDRQSGDRVELEVRMPHDHWGGLGHRSVRVELLVPHDADLDVHTGDGAVTVAGTKGNARLSTGDGSIRADGIDGSLDAKTGDGSVRVAGRFDNLRLNTGDGSIEAEAARGSQLAGPWQIRTGDGGVHVRLPSELNAELDLHTGDGSIHLDFPLLISGSQEKHWIRGKLNAGGQSLSIHTNDGSITVGKL